MSTEEVQQAEITRLLALVDTSEPWPILEVDIETCAFDDVKKSYRKKAHLIHPDRCQLPKGKEAFHVLDAAYQKVASEETFKRFKLKHEKAKLRKKQNEEMKAANKGAVDPADVEDNSPAAVAMRQREQAVLRAQREEEVRHDRKRRREEEEAKNNALNDHLHKLRSEWVDFGS